MVAVPADTPVTNPEVLTVAIDVLALLQVPPAVASASRVVLFAQNVAVPVMDEGSKVSTAIIAVW